MTARASEGRWAGPGPGRWWGPDRAVVVGPAGGGAGPGPGAGLAPALTRGSDVVVR
jgi:hypothetical protein